MPTPISADDMQVVYVAVRRQTYLSVKQVDDGFKFFERLASDLQRLGPNFYLAFAEAHHIANELNLLKIGRTRLQTSTAITGENTGR